MYEDFEFTEEESRIMRGEEGFARQYAELAFEDFLERDRRTSSYTNTLIPFHFSPRSIEDYQYVGLDVRYETLKSLIEIARSDAFRPERRAMLRGLVDFIDRTESDDYFNIAQLSQLIKYGPSLAVSLSLDINGFFTKYGDDLTEGFQMVRNALRDEYYKYDGYLGLVQQLIELGDTGSPDMLIPRSAFYYSYPPGGTRVVAWNYKDPTTKWYGRIPKDDCVGWQACRVEPIESPENSCKCYTDMEEYILGLTRLKKDDWFDVIFPAYVACFYLEHPELYRLHSRVLSIPNLSYVSDLIREQREMCVDDYAL